MLTIGALRFEHLHLAGGAFDESVQTDRTVVAVHVRLDHDAEWHSLLAAMFLCVDDRDA